MGSLSKVYSKLEQDFDNSFEEGQVAGWEDRGAGRLPNEQENAIDLQAFDTVEELESLGTALQAMLLKMFCICLPAQNPSCRHTVRKIAAMASHMQTESSVLAWFESLHFGLIDMHGGKQEV